MHNTNQTFIFTVDKTKTMNREEIKTNFGAQLQDRAPAPERMTDEVRFLRALGLPALPGFKAGDLTLHNRHYNSVHDIVRLEFVIDHIDAPDRAYKWQVRGDDLYDMLEEYGAEDYQYRVVDDETGRPHTAIDYDRMVEAVFAADMFGETIIRYPQFLTAKF